MLDQVSVLCRASYLSLIICCICFPSSSLIRSEAATNLSTLADFITGPHYISPLPVDVVVRTGYPAAITSTCTAGSVYTITSVNDLLSNLDQLECIYQAGQTPNLVPLGLHYGSVLKFGTSDSLVELFVPFWKGKVFSKLRCPTGNVYLGLNVIQGRFRVAAAVSIGTPQIKLAKGEYRDGSPSVIVDYTNKFRSLCQPPPGSMLNPDDLSLEFLDNLYPFRMVVDVVRAVGRQPDGGVVYLGKTYVQDPFRSDRQAYNVAFWSTVNYDPLVTNFAHGEALSPLNHTFTYSEPGAFQGFRLMFPLDNLVVDRETTVERFLTYYETFNNLIKQRLGFDLQRAMERFPTVHFKTLLSGIEFLAFKISWILARDSVSQDTSAESLVKLLLAPTGESEKKMENRDFDRGANINQSRTAAPDALPEQQQQLKQQQHPRQQATLASWLEALLSGRKSSVKTTEELHLDDDNNMKEKLENTAKGEVCSLEVLSLANNLRRLLGTIVENKAR